MVYRLDRALVHLHIHDYDGAHDHIELGAGHVDLEGLLMALGGTGYDRDLCLELNPGRVSPDGIRRSGAWLRSRIRELGPKWGRGMDRPNAYRRRCELRRNVIAAFSREPEIYEIHTFGREVEGDVDRYSDLDLVFCSADLRETQRKYRDILNAISPIVGSFSIFSTEDYMAEMVMLRDYAPYQKIDFSISGNLEPQSQFGPFKLLYRDEKPSQKNDTKLSPRGQKNDLQNRMNDILFSIPRFTKCLFRRDFDMYRRWVGITTATCVVLYEKHFGWREQPRDRLSPPEYRALYSALDATELRALDAVLPLSGDLGLAASFRASVHQFVALYEEKAESLGVELDGAFIAHIRRFMDTEIDRFLRGRQ